MTSSVRGKIRAALVLVSAFALWVSFGEAAHAATWCGTPASSDRKPQLVTGHNLHAVYAFPSDGADNSAAIAQLMQNDAEAIDAWWRRQDPTRAPRFDLTAFPCGAQLDFSVVRISATSAEVQRVDGRFERIFSAVYAAGFDRDRVKYLVYYDGPVEGDVCGQGGGDSEGGGVAVIYTAACAGIASASTAAHEFVHALGAMPRGAPHDCGGDDAGHPCDSEQDLLWPFASANGLDWYVLDAGRDDYYGHAGSWFDVQDSRWLRRLDAQVRLSVQLSGTGRIDSDVPGINCSASCDTDWDAGSVVALTPTAAAGQRFVRWGGSCSGFSGCSVQLGQAATVTAFFAPATFRLAVGKTGKGTVRSYEGSIECGRRCAAQVTSYEPARLTAVAAKGWRFARWSGACRGTRPVCRLPMTAASAARATFVRRPR